MAQGPRYKVPFRRRREGKTDYRKRLKLLLSGKLRLVIRKTLNNIICQIVEYDPKGDRVLITVHSKVLAKKFGWKAYRGNIPTAYLTGLVLGYEALKRNIKEAILDLGRQVPFKGGRLFAALKGCIDAGLKVPHGDGIFPSEERIRGEHIAKYAELLKKTDPEKYKRQFSRYLKNNLLPEELPRHFEEVKKKIIEYYS